MPAENATSTAALTIGAPTIKVVLKVIRSSLKRIFIDEPFILK